MLTENRRVNILVKVAGTPAMGMAGSEGAAPPMAAAQGVVPRAATPRFPAVGPANFMAGARASSGPSAAMAGGYVPPAKPTQGQQGAFAPSTATATPFMPTRQ